MANMILETALNPSGTGTILERLFSTAMRIFNRPDENDDGTQNQFNFVALPQIGFTKPNKREAVLILKLQQCFTICDFPSSPVELEWKEYKTSVLVEIIKIFRSHEELLTPAVYHVLIKMFECHAFRAAPRIPCIKGEDIFKVALSWPHMHLVYGLFVEFVHCPSFEPIICMNLINAEFVAQILNQIQSDNTRERQFSYLILGKIYEKFVLMRRHIRGGIFHILLRFLYESPEQTNGMYELLQIVGRIIGGLSGQVMDEYELLLSKVLIPLHKINYVQCFHCLLAHTMTLFVQKKESLGHLIISGLLKFWPKTCAKKEVKFLEEIQEILQLLPHAEFVKIQEPLFKRIAKSVEFTTSHFQVAEAALNMFNVPSIRKLIEESYPVIKPIMLPALSKIAECHWHKRVSIKSAQVLNSFKVNFPDMRLRVMMEQKKAKMEILDQMQRDKFKTSASVRQDLHAEADITDADIADADVDADLRG